MSKPRGKHVNYGFQRPKIQVSDHIFGKTVYAGAAVINPSGQYDDSRPLYEAQADKFETQGCTVWGTENAIETLHKFKFGVEKNYEELPPYIGAGLHPDIGGDPNTVAQWIHENGLVEAPAYPFPTSKEELLALLGKPLRSDIAALGQKWLSQYEMRHQWVLRGHENKEQRIEAIKGALQYGVLCVSVTAWFQKDGVFVDNGLPNSHWCVCYGWTEKGWKLFDSYDHSDKIYSYDSEVSFAKLYFLDKKLTMAQKKSLWEVIKSFLFGQPKAVEQLEPLLNPAMSTTKNEQLVETVKSWIGRDASPKNEAPQDYSCAEGLSNILHEVFPSFPAGVVSTVNLKADVLRSGLFKEVFEPKTGAVVISTRTEVVPGHCGVFITDTDIVSNDSKSGLMEQNYTWPSWIREFKEKRGLHTFLFQPI